MCPNFQLPELLTKLDGIDVMGTPAEAFEVSLVLPFTLDGVSDVAGFSPEAAFGVLSSLCFFVPILVAGVSLCLSVVILADDIVPFKIDRLLSRE